MCRHLLSILYRGPSSIDCPPGRHPPSVRPQMPPTSFQFFQVAGHHPQPLHTPF
jgi:hypothetical protein